MHNFPASQRRADNMIKRWGQPCTLRRAGVDRPVTAYILDYKPIERIGKLFNPTDRRAIVSALDPNTGLAIIAPDPEQGDVLMVPNLNNPTVLDLLRIIAPVGKIAPSDIVVVYDLQVRN